MNVNIELLQNIVTNNSYVKNVKSNKKKDENSLSYLVEKQLSQSECIKLGICYEKILQDIVLQTTNYKNIKPKNKKGEKEKDHLFMDEETDTIYYVELKANINLDSEKSKSTYLKCLEIVKELEITYPDKKIVWCLLGYRYIHFNEIPKYIVNKYSQIKNNVYGINQYFNMIGIDFSFTNETYKEFINYIVDKMCE